MGIKRPLYRTELSSEYSMEKQRFIAKERGGEEREREREGGRWMYVCVCVCVSGWKLIKG